MAYFIALCVIAFALLAGFAWHFQGELQEMARNLPSLPAFSICFGYRQLPLGLGAALRWLLEDAGLRNAFVLDSLRSALFTIEFLCFLVVAVIATAFRLASSIDVRSAFAALSPSEKGFLVVGAALVCGCFFTGQNNSYRGIYFLFVIPGLLALSTAPTTQRIPTIYRGTAFAIIFILWGLTIQQIVANLSGGSTALMIGNSAAAYIYWIIRELTWWWIVSVLLAFLFCFVAQSPVWRIVTGVSNKAEPGNTSRNGINPSFASRA